MGRWYARTAGTDGDGTHTTAYTLVATNTGPNIGTGADRDWRKKHRDRDRQRLATTDGQEEKKKKKVVAG